MADTPIEMEMQALKADIARLRDDVASLTGALADAGSSRASSMRDSVEHEFHARREEMRRLLSQAREKGRETVDDIEENIAQHPFGSIATAAGVGFILGRLLDGGRH